MASKVGRKQKLRASCDGCYHAKVKCKGTPTGCLRCLSQGLNCVYSPSMRNQTHNRNKKSEGYLIQKEQESYVNSIFPSDDLDMDFSTIPTGLEDLHAYFNTSDLTSLSAPSQDPDQLYLNNTLTGMVGSDHDIMNLDLHTKSSINRDHSKCQCFSEMMQAIETSRSQSLDIMGVDSVMNHNRQAMGRVCNLLRCTEEHDTMVGMLVLVLISKILNLCESVYRAQQGNDTDGDSPNWPMMGARTASTTSLNGTQVATPNSTQPSLSMSPSSGLSYAGTSTPNTRLTFGSHEFDQDDEHQLKTQMILIRLTKLKSLLNRFDSAQWTGGKSMMDISTTVRDILLEKVEAVAECMQMSVKL